VDTILALAALVGCQSGDKQYESDATEIVVRELLRSSGTNGPSTLFLACGHRLTPPSDTLLNRFADQPQVKSYAEHRVSSTGDIVDKATGKSGAMLQIAKVERKTGREFDVEAALSSLPVGSNRFVYTVVQDAGRWTIKSRRPL
jgi:hypothetical protein